MNPQNIPTVVTGSAAQVSKELAAQYGIEILPLGIYVDGKEYQDGINLLPGELYQKMRAEKLEVKTTAPSIGQYYKCFKQIFDNGNNEILCLTLSGKLSSDFNSASAAAEMIRSEYPAKTLMIFDSLRAAAPQGLLAVEAAKRLSEGEPLEKVVHYLEEARYRSGLIAALDTLDFLVQGGRIGKAAYLVGSALQIVPILSINKEGIVAPARIVNKRINIISALISILKKQNCGVPQDPYICHARRCQGTG